MPHSDDGSRDSGAHAPRRGFLSTAAAMCGLAAGYGTLLGMAGRYLYLYPAGASTKSWRFVARLSSIGVGDSVQFEAPTGAQILIARRSEAATAEAFVALSRVCPHLGCLVHWEPHHERFFCPCHNGVFDRQGKPISGPPASAGQSLAAYPLKVEEGLLYVEVPVVGLGSPEEV